ncbi:MAG TPA: hypothetical protein VG125_19705 [Pirellulales bacterium]|nr:hypothetical protein [Pirellulales bacterium]
MKPRAHDSRKKYEILIDPLRAEARRLGYALAVHGSLLRDIDLLACPWTEGAAPGAELAKAICLKAAEINRHAILKPPETDEYFRRGCPGFHPHGRLCWTFHLGGGPYIDLSVMPRSDPPGMDGRQILDAMKTLPLLDCFGAYVKSGELVVLREVELSDGRCVKV